MSSTSSIVIDKKKVKNPPLDVYQLGDKGLRQPAKRVTKIDEELRETVRQMLQTMYSQDGIGLAAPQVGINKQLVVIDTELDKPEVEPLVLINPVVKRITGPKVTDQEGCLSVVGVYMDVVRQDVVEISYKDEHGRLKTLTADGLLSRVIQHEIDHLNGIMFVDRIPNHLALGQELQKKGFTLKAVKSVP
jgi:peptide deformylase